jgi:hypothetical protein
MVSIVSIGRLVTWFSLVAVLLGTMLTYALAPSRQLPSIEDDLCIVPAPVETANPATHAGLDGTSHQGHVDHAGQAGGPGQSGRSAHWHDSMVDHCLHCLFRSGRGGPVPHAHLAAGPSLHDVGLPAPLFLASDEPSGARATPQHAGFRLR